MAQKQLLLRKDKGRKEHFSDILFGIGLLTFASVIDFLGSLVF